MEAEQFGFPGGGGVSGALGPWEGDSSPVQPEGLFSCQFRAPGGLSREVGVGGVAGGERW